MRQKIRSFDWLPTWGQFLIAVVALVLSVIALYRQFFYESEKLNFLLTDFRILKTSDEGRRVRVGVTYALANSGTQAEILSSMCLVLSGRAVASPTKDPYWVDVPQAGMGSDFSSYTAWRSDPDGGLPDPVLVEPGKLVQKKVFFDLVVYADGQPQTAAGKGYQRRMWVHLDLVDNKGRPTSSEIYTGMFLTEGTPGNWGYGWEKTPTVVLPKQVDDPSERVSTRCSPDITSQSL